MILSNKVNQMETFKVGDRLDITSWWGPVKGKPAIGTIVKMIPGKYGGVGLHIDGHGTYQPEDYHILGWKIIEREGITYQMLEYDPNGEGETDDDI